jgi:NADPH-dependent L-lysine 6-monooxygenase-like protein
VTTLLAGLGPAGTGLLIAMLRSNALAGLCNDGLLVVDPDLDPGAGGIADFDLRSDSAAAVFASCVEPLMDDPLIETSAALDEIRTLPDGEAAPLPIVASLLHEAAASMVRRVQVLGGEVRLGTRLQGVRPRGAGGATVVLSSPREREVALDVDRVIIATGGTPYVPPRLTENALPAFRHSHDVLRRGGLQQTLDRLPANPVIVVVGGAHSAFAVADQLLSTTPAQGWGPSAMTIAVRGQVKVTYADPATAAADGAAFSAADVCPDTGRVWRFAGLRGDAARRYQLARDGHDDRLTVIRIEPAALADRLGHADLVVFATGYRAACQRLLPSGWRVRANGQVVDQFGGPRREVVVMGLGSGSRRSPAMGGEPSYQGPLDGVWHYQNRVAPELIKSFVGATTTKTAQRARQRGDQRAAEHVGAVD